ncbi:hypothetical protein H310_06372 [Aphanomyces invadans]|uniref:SGNH hydrolase-type esterase domain-containing protein n=1 Tax=Aphanomyces invadans TaxID=157072 RepID=A0A024U869_9STRA|nr:hypothetical protein H310_06372 [Aphanomyces invadans]ETW01793.1 hypothetical protein H310_06372 [Aphanomyces invadans]|eukprot:XP_008869641.1 hypothetical protein H310_06372 [Aphanomyces invadans]
MLPLVLYVYVAVRTAAAWLWLRFCRWLTQPLRLVLKANEYQHKIVIIGDGFAAGFGDWITMATSGGLSQYLAQEVAKEDKIRHRWQVINRGILDTDSSQWHPTSSTKYFQDVFSVPQLRDADIVMVIVGSIDSRRKNPSISPEQTVCNIQAICDALRKKGKRVCVGSLCHADFDTENETHRVTNQALVDYCESTKMDDLPVKLTPDLSTPVVRRSDSKAFDGYHFNAKAYQQIARDSMAVLTPLLTAVEWATWKKQLEGVKYDPALYD